MFRRLAVQLLLKLLVLKRSDFISDLTTRERAIIGVLLRDPTLQNKEIANLLSIAPRTVKFHMSNLYRKYDVMDRRELIKVIKAQDGDNK